MMCTILMVDVLHLLHQNKTSPNSYMKQQVPSKSDSVLKDM